MKKIFFNPFKYKTTGWGYWGLNKVNFSWPFYITIGEGGMTPFIFAWLGWQKFIYLRLRIPFTYLCFKFHFGFKKTKRGQRLLIKFYNSSSKSYD